MKIDEEYKEWIVNYVADNVSYLLNIIEDTPMSWKEIYHRASSKHIKKRNVKRYLLILNEIGVVRITKKGVYLNRTSFAS